MYQPKRDSLNCRVSRWTTHYNVSNGITADACLTTYLGKFIMAQQRFDNDKIKNGEIQKVFIRGIRPNEVEIQVYERYNKTEPVELLEILRTTRELLRIEESRVRVLGKPAPYIRPSDDNEQDSSETCQRCHRIGHDEAACCAVKDENGKELTPAPAPGPRRH